MFQKALTLQLVNHTAVDIAYALSEPGNKAFCRYTPGQAESQKHELFHLGLYAQLLKILSQRLIEFRFVVEMGRYVALEIGRIMETAALQIGGSAQSQSQISGSGPVSHIMAAFEARSGIIGYLIPFISLLTQTVPGHVIHFPFRVLIRKIRKRH